MRKQLLLLLFSIFAVMGYARTVTGVVKQASDKETIIGASVRVHGTTRGVTTDFKLMCRAATCSTSLMWV